MAHQEPSGSPRVLRQLNRNHILRVIRASGPISRGDLARNTGLSRPTVNEVVSELLAEDIVEERISDGYPARPGPRAKLVRFRGEAGYVLGVDVGATKAVVQLADLDGHIVATERADTGSVRSRADVLRIIRREIDTVTESAGVSLADIQAVGIGSPGVVDPETGALSLAPQLPGWEGITLSEELDPRISAPIKAANEVHLAVLGERWHGAARDARDAVYLHIGVGIGLGILIDGKLHPGSAGAAGEIGYLPLPEPDPSRRPDVGALEYAASGAAFARRGRAAARRPDGARLTELAGGDPDAVDARTVFQAVSEGDAAATRIRDELIELLARATAAVCLVLDPTTVILGGGLSQAGAALAAPLEQHVRQLVPMPPRIEVSELGDLAVTYGAVRLALDHVDEMLYGVDGYDEAQRKATT
jgi:predicted NBD/HSP70 family sugar kinase